MKSATVARRVVVVCLVAGGTVACAGGGPHGSSGDPATAGVGIQLRISRTSHIQRVHYAVTGPNAFSASGSIDVSTTREAEGTIPGVPAGGPYGIVLNAVSTDGNVTCIGSKGGITVTCPGDLPKDEKDVRLVCLRNHVGREWGDKGWRENGRTFYVGAEVNLVCPPADAGADASTDAASTDAAADASADADSGNPCGAGPLTTACLFKTQDRPASGPTTVCSSCVVNNGCFDPAQQGGTCEGLTGVPTTALSGTLPDGKTCAQVLGPAPTETSVCLQSLETIFGSQCAAGLQETPCLCGATPANQCLSCQATPTGPLFDEFACDNGSANICSIIPNVSIANGVGTANALIECAANFGCNCFARASPADAGAADAQSDAADASADAAGSTDAEAGAGDARSDAAGSSVGADSGNACGPGPGAPLTTACIFKAQDKATTTDPTRVCSSCVLNNGCFDPTLQGVTCEGLSGAPTSALSGTLPDGKTCAQVFGPAPSETSVCLQSLETIFGSGCGSSLSVNPCLCGATLASGCLACTAIPMGPLFDTWACDNGSQNLCAGNNLFLIPNGVATANALFQCAAINGCDCF